MPSQIGLPDKQLDLRLRATARLKGPDLDITRASASEALGVLFQLASSPSTAQDALALLHELQVHQIELELQDEELRGSRIELEQALNRQTELYDCAPVGYFTIDAKTVVHELNLRGATLLGQEQADLLGRPLDGVLDERSGDGLHTLIARVGRGQQSATCALAFAVRGAQPRTVQASASRDPAGERFLLVLTDSAQHHA
jgi:PAS domain-containing protein